MQARPVLHFEKQDCIDISQQIAIKTHTISLLSAMNSISFLELDNKDAARLNVHGSAGGPREILEPAELTRQLDMLLRDAKDSFELSAAEDKTYITFTIKCRDISLQENCVQMGPVSMSLRFPVDKHALFAAAMTSFRKLPDWGKILSGSDKLAGTRIANYMNALRREETLKRLEAARARPKPLPLPEPEKVAPQVNGSIKAMIQAHRAAQEVMALAKKEDEQKKSPVAPALAPAPTQELNMVELQPTASVPEQPPAPTLPGVERQVVVRKNQTSLPAKPEEVRESAALESIRDALEVVEDVLAEKAPSPEELPVLSGLGNSFLTFLVQACKSFFTQKTTKVPALRLVKEQITAKIRPWLRGSKDAVNTVVDGFLTRVEKLFEQAAASSMSTDRVGFFRRLDTLRSNLQALRPKPVSAGVPLPRATSTSVSKTPPAPKPRTPDLEIFTSKPTLLQKVSTGLQKIRNYGASLFVAR